MRNGDVDHFGGQDLTVIYEFALLELGGQELLDDARTMAHSDVDAEHPWSRSEPEPEERVAAYVTSCGGGSAGRRGEVDHTAKRWRGAVRHDVR